MFSPNGGCTDKILNLLDESKQEVLVQAYVLTSKPIISSLIAHKARVIIDRMGIVGLPKNVIESLVVDPKHVIAHNKIMIIDRQIVITGSFNFTENAELHNAENLVIIHDESIAHQYITNWNNHFSHSVLPHQLVDEQCSFDLF